ncbi:hypothetical protein ACFXPS_05165 [Nocardia sp. NPDC059091]|uniref:hypothetical protein n=1 Tax=Nocardia sp. NPDC059091 TaxID=3346724 RepID=UPI0036A9B628
MLNTIRGRGTEHVDIDHYWPLAAALEAALLGGWPVVVARTARPGERTGPHREPTRAREEGTEPRGDWALVLTLLLWAALIPEILPVPSANLVTELPGFMLMYGGAAVLARAAVRIRGLGWPAPHWSPPSGPPEKRLPPSSFGSRRGFHGFARIPPRGDAAREAVRVVPGAPGQGREAP